MKPLGKTDCLSRSADLARAAAIFLVVFAVYFVGYSRTLPPTADEMIDFGLAQSMAKWQVFSIDQVSTVGPNPEEFGLDGHRYSKYGPLQAVLSVPLFWLAQRLPIGAVDTVLLLNHLATALSMALLFLLVRRLGYRPGVALALVALVAFGTPLWIHSKRYFAEPTITLCVIATMYATYAATTTRRPVWAILTGLSFGIAVAAKYVDAVLLLPVPIYLALSAATREPGSVHRHGAENADRPEQQLPGTDTKTGSDGSRFWLHHSSRITHHLLPIVWFGIGVAPVAALLVLYDLVRFGNPLASGYAHWESFSTPIWVGVLGFLFSPGKSIFVYTPFFLLLPFWAPGFIRRFPGFSAMLGTIIAIHLGLYGSWWVWWGAWAWGPRFIVPILPLVALFLAEGFAGLGGEAVNPELEPRLYANSRPETGEGSVLLRALTQAGVDTGRSIDLGARASGPLRPTNRADETPALLVSENQSRPYLKPYLLQSALWDRISKTARTLAPVVVVVLGLLSFVIQVLGISVDHTVYLVQLLPLNSKPDTLTLYDLRYQPILHQIPLMTRQWLDFAWIERTGPSAVNFPALAAVATGAVAALVCFVVVWSSRGWARWLPSLGLAALVVGGSTYQALRIYARTIDPTTAAIVQALAKAPDDTGIVQLIPSDVVPYDNWQKRSLPELGWIEEPTPSPIIVERIHRFEEAYPRIWVLTQTPPKVPSNGIEAMLDRSLVQVGDEPVGSFRLLRYVTRPSSLHFVGGTWRFADGIELDGFVVNGGPPEPGHTFDLTLRWRAGADAIKRPDYTVFVHLVTRDGTLIAQHDDPPASGYAPTSSWAPGQVVYDDHAITVPANAPGGLHLVQVGLYLPSTGKRVPLLGPDGKVNGDTATLDMRSSDLGSAAGRRP